MEVSRVVKLLASLLVLLKCQVNSQSCQAGWLKLDSKCFLFVSQTFDYDGAVNNCIAEGGRLFEPKNEHANDRIARVALSRLASPLDYWIGIDDLDDNGVFKYKSSGLKIKYSNWVKNPTDQPDNNQTLEHCVAVKGLVGLWEDEDCASLTKMSVCEDLQDNLPYWGPCEPGWDLIGGKCYKLIHETMKYDAANNLCQSFGGKLFEPRYESQEETVLTHYFGASQSQAVWLGITDIEFEGQYTFASNDLPIEYTNWGPKSPGDQPSVDNCVLVNDKVWDAVCCQLGNIAMPLCEEQPVQGCKAEPQYETIRGRCFYFGNQPKNYTDAIADCESKGGRLFEPRSSEANQLVYERMRNSVSIPFWIGVNARDNGTFIYTNTGDPVTFFKWATGQPYAENPSAYCVQLQTHRAEWNDIHCGARRNYVCEFPGSFQPFFDTQALSGSETKMVDFIFDMFFNTKMQEAATSDSDASLLTNLASGSNRVLVVGGLDITLTQKDWVYRVDLDTKQICYHSTFPTTIKEAHVFELNNELYVCSSTTGISTAHLNCWKWEGASGWVSFPTPTANGVKTFIQSVYVPNVGMWFQSINAGKSLILSESTTTFGPGLHWTLERGRSCSVMLTDTKVAQIGGDGPGPIAATIDTYDFATNVEVVNASQISTIRKHHGCAAIKGKNGNPSVLILGSLIAPVPLYMEIWDSVTNEIETVPHPEGLDSNSLFRPLLLPIDDTSVMLVSTGTRLGAVSGFLENFYKFTYGLGWEKVAPNPAPLNTVDQSGAYLLKNSNLLNFDTLDKCAP